MTHHKHGPAMEAAGGGGAVEGLKDVSLGLSSVIDGMLESLVILDRSYRIIAANRQAIAIDGRTAAALIGRTIWDVWPGLIGSPLEKAYRDGLERQISSVVEHHYQWEQHDVWLRVRTAPCRDGAAVFYEDISARKRVEEELARTVARLRESEARLAAAQDAGGVATWEWDLQTGQTFWSTGVTTLLGLEPSTQPSFAGFLERIHPDDRSAVRAALDRTIDGEAEAFTADFRVIRADTGALRYIAGRGKAERDDGGQAVRLRGVNFDITDRKATEDALRSSEARFRAVLDTSIDGFMVLDSVRDPSGRIVDFRWLHANDAAERIVGRPKEWFIGRRLLDEMPGNKQDGLFDGYARVVETGEPWTTELRYRHDGLDAYLRIVAAKAEDGLAVSFADLSESRRTAEAQSLLMREVDHRAKNALAVVQALVSLTRADTIDGFKTAVQGRIAAMGRAHSVLALNRWQGAELSALIEEEFLAFAGRCTLSGPAVALKAAAAQPVVLAVHELATNAVKYGALSTAHGHVTVTWTILPETDEVEIRWVETGGPPVHPPERRGFGSVLLGQGIEDQIGGTLSLDWRQSGLVCVIRLPTGAHWGRSERVPGERGGEFDQPVRPLRILIIEDEPLVAIQLEVMLAEHGHRVTRRVGWIDEAMRAIGTDEPDLVMLDANLHGASAQPLAVILHERGIPFIWCTGYETVPGGTYGAPVVAKPFQESRIRSALAEVFG